MFAQTTTPRPSRTSPNSRTPALNAARVATVETAQHYRRENVVTLTPADTELLRRGDEAFERERGTTLRSVDPHDIQAVIRVLSAMSHTLDPTVHAAADRE
ncbi:hypothetical protein ABH926_000956 [Catenulispora sp. GP43]|uniref:hypothetical protein n=1 Tax=Catenulispora sp. GP43 TaxID=3156263 RepID=UPI00351882B5